MSAKTWIPLAAAIILGLTAALVARHSLAKKSAAPQVKTVSVVVAKVAIAPGEELRADELTQAVLPGATRPPDTFANPSELVGRVTASPVLANQAINGSLLAAKGSGTGLQALVPVGMRAITIDVTEASAVAGLLVPGCRVDVVTTTMSQENSDRTRSRLIVQDVPVLAVGQRLNVSRSDGEKEKDPGMSRTVTLMVTPRDAEAVDLAATAARLRLVLRGSGDTDEADDEGVMLAELRGSSGGTTAIPPPPPVAVIKPIPATQPVAAAEPPRRRIVTVIQGGIEHQVVFREEKTDAPKADVTDADLHQAVPQ